jgi:glycosyltransferase involved in cell wall biosynthesis
MSKICFLAPATFKSEGSTTHIVEVWKRIPGLLEAEVHIVIIEGKNDKRIADIKNLKIYEIPEFFNKLKVHFFKSTIYQLYALLYCLRLKDLKLVYSRYTTINITDILISKIKQIPLIVEVNGIYKDERSEQGFDRLKIFMNKITGKRLFSVSTQIIPVTDKLRSILITDYKVPSEKIKVINNGVDEQLFKKMDKYECRQKIGINKKLNVICFVGSLAFWQGVEYLIDSIPLVLKQFPDTEILIVGSGHQEHKLKRRARDLNIEKNINFLGWVEYKKVPLYINASDICVAPFTRSRNEEIGLSPLKLYEYMACNKPIVASDINGVGNILLKYNVGIPVKPEDPNELSQALIKLLKNPDLGRKIGDNGRKIVINNFTWKINAEKVTKICKKFLN